MKDDRPVPLLASLLSQQIRRAEDRADRVYEAVIGLVVDNKDPDKLGRVKVRFPTLPGQDTSWWAPLAVLGAGKNRGWFFLPEIDDEVLVMFEHGDFRRPVVLGALWNGVDLPPEKNGGKNERRVLVSRQGSRVELDDDKGTITIEDGGKFGRLVISAENKITLEAKKGDLVLQAPEGELSVVAAECDIQAQQALKIQAGSAMNMGASTVSVQGARVTVTAGRLDLNPGAAPGPAAASASPEEVPDQLGTSAPVISAASVATSKEGRFHPETSSVVESAAAPEELDGRPVPPGPAETPDETTERFEVRFVDELGQAIDGLDVIFAIEGRREKQTTDGSGIARAEGKSRSASVKIASPESLVERLKPRWDQVRGGKLVTDESDVIVVPYQEPIKSVSLEPEVQETVSIQPHVALARLIGMFFDTNKSFLLPNAMVDIKRVRQLYDEHPDSVLLVVGHTDTTGEPSINDPLSLERAQSVAAYLTDDVNAWLAMYDSSAPSNRRWGLHEDLLMMQSVMGGEAVLGETPVLAFQKFHNAQLPADRPTAFESLQEDGVIGPRTRAQLIADYMNEDGTTLPDGVELVAHGCGENFPLDDTGQDIDPAPRDPEEDQVDRRVELFFFDGKLGVQPKPPGDHSSAGSREYPEWRRRVQRLDDFDADLRSVLLRVRMLLNGTALASEDFLVFSEQRLLAAGTTNGDGLVTVEIPAGIDAVSIRVPKHKLERPVSVLPTESFPTSDDVVGVQVRLRQLGFFFGPVDGKLGPEIEDAIRVFKVARGLSDTSDVDDATRSELASAYGS